MKKYFSSIFYFIGILLLITLFILYPKLCIEGAKDGLLLWFQKLLPSLFPFIVLINSLSSLDILLKGCSRISPFTKRYLGISGQGFFTFVLGAISGYPTGAKIVERLLKQEQISYREAENLLCFCNNCGPLFIIGTVGVLFLDCAPLGYFLLLIHLLSSISVLFLFHNRNFIQTSHADFPISQKSIISIFNESISNAMDSIVYVGGYIIFFSVLIRFLESFLSNLNDVKNLSILLLGALEISTGIADTSILLKQDFSLALLAFISGLIGFGGFCVYFQVLHFIKDFPIRIPLYLFSKTIQAILSVCYTLLLFPIWHGFFYHTTFTFPLSACVLCLLVLVFIRLMSKKLFIQ